MADLRVHIAQAEHNKDLAERLLNDACPDWVITICFYAAIHCVEAKLFLCYAHDPDKQHTDACIPLDRDGKQEYSSHRWRSKRIQEIIPNIRATYRNLQIASEWARYLARSEQGQVSSLNQGAFLYFKASHAEQAVARLQEIRTTCRTELTSFIYSLDLEQHTNQGDANHITNELLRNYASSEELLSDKQSLVKLLYHRQVKTLEECLNNKGHEFS